MLWGFEGILLPMKGVGPFVVHTERPQGLARQCQVRKTNSIKRSVGRERRPAFGIDRNDLKRNTYLFRYQIDLLRPLW